MRILEINRHQDLQRVMQEIKVDPYGIQIMLPKAFSYLIRVNSLSNISANILKQEMLALGGDVAIARGALTGKAKKTDCLLMANLSQFKSLQEKLNRQPFGLDKLAQNLSVLLANYQKNNFTLSLGKYTFRLGQGKTYIMAIVNLTPDSFSGDGLYRISQIAYRKSQINDIIENVEKMVNDGADIIDIGGESSRPGARPVSIKEELIRTIPIIKALIKKIKLPLSIDTYKPEVAQQALDCGVSVVNDITGLRNPKMAKLISRYKAGVVIMHMKGTPQTMQKNPGYKSLIDEIIEYLNQAINVAVSWGIDRERIIIDPGIGFGKTLEHNLEILKRLKEFKVLGQPILVGTSRKSFIGKILNAKPYERLFGTVATSVLAAQNGANIVRVHDVKQVRQALSVINKINQI